MTTPQYRSTETTDLRAAKTLFTVIHKNKKLHSQLQKPSFQDKEFTHLIWYLSHSYDPIRNGDTVIHYNNEYSHCSIALN